MGAALPESALPRDLGSFRLVQVIGEGGMGVVYRAQNVATGEEVALKTVKRVDRRMLSAMRIEIAGLRSINHPGVVRILAEGESDGLPWYAMQMLQGRSLSRHNRRFLPQRTDPGSPPHGTTSLSGPAESEPTLRAAPATVYAGAVTPPFPVSGPRQVAAGGKLPEVLSLYRGLCAPLAFIHSRGMVHRDLKPSNVWIQDDGTAVLMDFGLISYAKGAIGREILSGGPRVLGTLNYVAPEQIKGQLVDARADLYSLGCMLYESVTGRPPFDGTRQEILNRHLYERPVPPSKVVDGVPVALERLISGLLSKGPRERIGHAGDVAAALTALLGDESAPEKDGDAPAHLYRPQLAGRDDVLEQLLLLWRQAENGRGGFVLLGGESGIGKTFLMAEFAQRVRQDNARVVTGDCVPVIAAGVTSDERFAGEPLHPLRGLFQSMSDACREGGPEVARRIFGDRGAFLAPYLPASGEPDRGVRVEDTAPDGLPTEAGRARLLQCLTATVAAFAAESPLLLVVDDLQWADDLTIAFLASLPAEFFTNRKLLVVGTYRSEEVGPDLRALLEATTATRMVLRSLDEAVVASIVRDMLAISAAPADLTAFVAHESEGNPFFVAEYLRLLVADGVLEWKAGHWRVANPADGGLDAQRGTVPRSIQGLISRRLARLEVAARNIAEIAAVLGRELEFDILVATSGAAPDEVAVSVREAINRQVLEELDSGRLRFMHDKLRESAYASIPDARRVALHRAAAEAIEARFPDAKDLSRYVADLAHHWKSAGTSARAIAYLDRAGREALAKSANRDAVAFFREALQQAALQPATPNLVKARWHRQIADALYGVGLLQESASEARAAAALLGWPSPRSSWRLALSLVGQIVRQFAHRLAPGRFLRSRAQDSEALVEAARGHTRLLQGSYFKGEVLVLFHACVTSLNLTELAETSPELTATYASAFITAGVVPARKLAESYYRLAHENLIRHPDSEKESNLALFSAIYRTGTAGWKEVAAELAVGLKLALELRFARRIEDLRSVTSIAAFLRGELEEAMHSAVKVCESAARGNLQTLCWGVAEKAQVLLARNRPDAAIAELRTVEPHLKSDELGRTERLWVQALMARAALRGGDDGAALRAGERAVEQILSGPPISFAWVDAYASAAEVFLDLWRRAAQSGSPDVARLESLARKVCRQLKPLARLFPSAQPCADLWTGRYLWQHGRHRKAIERWQQSLASARRLQMPHDEGLALLALSEASPDAAGVRERLMAAVSIFERLGASYGLMEARRRLETAGA